ncbi:uncharacterized protein LOC126735616 [Anthonomus grandis grandis]|uniref:uncharacterized protein LOC126735616 n=1 Tax=Anthonomus grandis grandis TaxID=2921223 RepID=UPI00216599EC|nr:uncharacterized protein LOC126735616 [Anthonomus grandis grandis]
MREYKNGDDLLSTFNEIHLDKRHLSSNVFRAWFDTDCKDTKEYLSWFSMSLREVNYVSPLEQEEFKNIREQIDLQTYSEELKRSSNKSSDILNVAKNKEDILILEEELLLLEEENHALDNLIEIYEQLDNNLTLDLTLYTKKEIETSVEWKRSLQSCKVLSSAIDDCYNNISLDGCDPDAYLTNMVDQKQYLEALEKVILMTSIDAERTFLEKSEEFESLELDVCKKRILHSQQIYIGNCVEIEKLKDVMQFLNTVELRGPFSLPNSIGTNAKELRKKMLCDDLDSVIAKLTKHYLKQAQHSYNEFYLIELEKNLQEISLMSEDVIKCLSYYIITNSLLVEEKKDVEILKKFYHKMDVYARDVLRKCQIRTEQMQAAIDYHKSCLLRTPSDKFKLISSIRKILFTNGHSLQSIADSVCKFKNDLEKLELQMFCLNLRNEKKKMKQINEDINTLTNFLTSGPTNRVLLVPFELQQLFFTVEEHLGKEGHALEHAMDIHKQATKSMTKAQNYIRDLWISFITNPSRLDVILQQAEDDFKRRTEQYF